MYIKKESKNMMRYNVKKYSLAEHIDSFDLSLVSSIVLVRKKGFDISQILTLPISCRLPFLTQKNYKAKLKRKMAEYTNERVLEARSKIEKSEKYKYGQRYTKTGIRLYFVI
jgi:hypothetical protein